MAARPILWPTMPSNFKKSEKSNERILRKMRKTRFLVILGPFSANLGPNGPNRNFFQQAKHEWIPGRNEDFILKIAENVKQLKNNRFQGSHYNFALKNQVIRPKNLKNQAKIRSNTS